MDKYEFKHLMEEIQSLIDQGKYADAAAIADKIDWRRVKNVMTLGKISDLYKINRRYEDARDILLFAYDRKPENRQICYSLCEMYCKTGEPVEATEFYKEYEKLAPKDPGRYILKYKVYDAFGTGIDEKIEVLEKLKEAEYQEKWMYELAKLYDRRGLATKCVEVCDELILWFGCGKYVNMAMELKMLHAPLSPEQQKIYNSRFQNQEDNQEFTGEEYTENQETAPYQEEAVATGSYDAVQQQPVPYEQEGYFQSQKTEEVQESMPYENPAPQEDAAEVQSGNTRMYNVEEVRRVMREKSEQTVDANDDIDIQVKTVDVGRFNTMNLQAEIAKGMQEVMQDEFAEKEQNGPDAQESVPVADGLSMDASGYFAAEPSMDASGYFAAEPSMDASGYFAAEPSMDASGYFEVEEQAPVEDEINKRVMQEMQRESMNHLVQEAMTARPPEPMAQVLAQESDGQLRLVIPEGKRLEKQITGQLSIEDIRAEWERMKQENRAKQEEEVRQQVLRHTGKMFTEFEERMRDSILKKMEDSEEFMAEVQKRPLPDDGMVSEVDDDSFRMESIDDFKDSEFNFDFADEDIKDDAKDDVRNMAESAEKTAETVETESTEEVQSAGEAEAVNEPEFVWATEDINEPESAWTTEDVNEPESAWATEDINEPENTDEAETESVAETADEPESESAAETADEPESESAAETADEPESESAAETADEPESESAAETADEPESESAAETADEPEPENVVETAEETENQSEPETFKEPEDEEDEKEFVPVEQAGYDEQVSSFITAKDIAGKVEIAKSAASQPGLDSLLDGDTWGDEAEESEFIVQELTPKQREDEVEVSEEEEVEVSEEDERSVNSYDDRVELEPDDGSIDFESLPQEEEFAEPEEYDSYENRDDLTKQDGDETENWEEARDKEQDSEDYVTEESDQEDAEEGDSSLRAMTKEEEAIYGSLIQSDSMKEQLVRVVDAISMAPYIGNVVITGEGDMNTLELAKKIICEIKNSDGNFVGTVAKISGKALNARSVSELLDGLRNGALIIEKPSAMTSATVDELYNILQRDTFGIVVFLLDSKKGINGLFKKYEKLKPMFNARMHMKPLSEEVLARYARQYAYDNEFSIDSMGLLALHTRIDEMQTAKHAVTYEDVREIMDDAMDSASALTIRHFCDILFGRRYDDEDMIVITERDFK